MFRRLGLLIGLAALVGFLAFGEDEEPLKFDHALSFHLGLDWIGQPYSAAAANKSANGIESHMLLPTVGGGYTFRAADNIYLNLMLDIFIKEFVYRSDLGRAFPTPNETGKQTGPLALVVGLLPQAIFQFEFPMSAKAVFGMGAGLALNFNLALIPMDGSTGIDAIGTYLFGAFKVPYLISEFHFRFPAGSILTFAPQLKAYWPIYHLWDGENLPLTDRLIINLGVLIQIKV